MGEAVIYFTSSLFVSAEKSSQRKRKEGMGNGAGFVMAQSDCHISAISIAPKPLKVKVGEESKKAES